jgi:hypothetical protein
MNRTVTEMPCTKQAREQTVITRENLETSGEIPSFRRRAGADCALAHEEGGMEGQNR